MRVTLLRLNQRFTLLRSEKRESRKRVFCFPEWEQIMFGLKKKSKIVELYSPVNGKVVYLNEVPDPVFAQEMMGPGIAFLPCEGKFYAPCDGELVTIFPTKHAIGIKAGNGAEILLHVGIDTVQLNGECFILKVQQGQKVHKGDLLLEADMDEIQKRGFHMETPMIITNSQEYTVTVNDLENAKIEGEPVLFVEKK